MCLTARYSALTPTTSLSANVTPPVLLLPAKSVAVTALVLMRLSSARHHVILTHSFYLQGNALPSPVPLATIAKLQTRSVFSVILLAQTVEALFPLTVTPVLMASPFLSKIKRKEDV